MCRPSNFVSNTTTSSGTRKMRDTVSMFGRFMVASNHMISSVVADEGDPNGGGQRHAVAPADDSHAETNRPDFRSSVSPLSARSPQERPRNRRSHPQPELPAA